MTVFVVIEQGCFDFDVNVDVEVYTEKEKAVAEWKRRVELAETDANNFLTDDERVIEKNEKNLSCDIYKDGRASEWEINIWVKEKQIDE